jgi:hypothetical protein
MFFDDDICLCGNSDSCPYKNECLRAERRGPGIFTVSLFYQEDKECEYFIKKRRGD